MELFSSVTTYTLTFNFFTVVPVLIRRNKLHYSVNNKLLYCRFFSQRNSTKTYVKLLNTVFLGKNIIDKFRMRQQVHASVM